jgi:D-alanine-D-alanine ligase
MINSKIGRVAVLMGGNSSEREISLMSGQGVLEALRSQGIDAEAVDPLNTPIWSLKDQGFDQAFIALHGCNGEDGQVQAILNAIQLPYTGSGVAASALAMDKWRTKLVWIASGLPTPAYRILDVHSDVSQIEYDLGLPLVAKPISEGSSIGVVKIYTADALKNVHAQLERMQDKILVEQMIQGPEYTVGILDGRALPSIRIDAPDGTYDLHHKYYSDDTRYYCPSGLSDEDEALLSQLAIQAFDVLGCRGWGRIDVMRDQTTGKFSLLELNTSPGMTSHSLVPMAAKQIGLSYPELCVHILSQANVE